MSPFIEACSSGAVQEVKVLLGQGADVAEQDSAGQNGMWHACTKGHAEVVSELLSHGSTANDADEDGYSCLMSAALQGHMDIVDLLLAEGAAINTQADDGTTALMYACTQGHPEVVHLLLSRGADVATVSKEGKTALLFSARDAHTENLKLLLSAGASLSAADDKGETAFYMAAHQGSLPCLEILLLHKANVEATNDEDSSGQSTGGDPSRICVPQRSSGLCQAVNNPWSQHFHIKEGKAPLMRAASEGHVQIVQWLLSQGAQVDAQDTWERTALWVAALHGRTDVAETLLSHGAHVDLAGDSEGFTCLMGACTNEDAQVVKLLLSKGANIHAHDGTELLLSNGALVADLDNQGRSVVWIAANKGHTSILELLMSHGADINTAYQEGVTLLIEASKASESDSVQLLLSKGADVAATDNQGKTAIQYAFEDNNLEIVKALLAHGADVSTNDHAYSPLLLAVLQGDVSKVKQVLSEAADQADLMRMLNHQSVFTHALGRGLPQSEGGWTPLLLACEEGQVEIVNAILTSAKSEASTLLETVSTLTEYTPLMHACKNNNLKLAKMLISFGAVVKAEYEEGETAEDVAAMFAQHEVADWLAAL
ncbi:TPA: hypothetical protein ACH3X3_003914 [Trebouxia sp. C0006]